MTVWAALRGLAVGVASVAAAVAVALAIVESAPVDTSPCDSELACLPDLGPLILAVTSMPLVMAVVGPLVAWLLRASRPLFFTLPAAWALVLVCVGLGTPSDRWPFNDTVSSVALLVLPYILVALWISRRSSEFV
jgi:hypothetical protein